MSGISFQSERSVFISKSRFVEGLQCDKLLWHRYKAKEKFPAVDDNTQAIFDQGKEVGNYAKKLFPKGVEITADHSDYNSVLAESREALKMRVPLFEAAFAFAGGYARIDILDPVGTDEWDIVEVKSSTEVKDVHLADVAFQKFICAGVGLRIRKCCVMLIDNSYVRRGDIDPRKLFTQSDVTKLINPLVGKIASQLIGMQATIGLSTSPAKGLGRHCDDPYTCALKELCWSVLPEHSVFDLYRSQKKFDWYAQGIVRIANIPAGVTLSNNQEVQRRAVLSGKPVVDKPALRDFLNQLQYPISYLDFESIAFAVPMFDNSWPYQQIPFQWSLHTVTSAGEEPRGQMFLAESRNDPRAEFMTSLRDAIPKTGSIVVFNASFEKARLNECAELLPEFKAWTQQVNGRIVDLLAPFRSFSFYHPAQQGSNSIKDVLPALTGKSYDALKIQDGQAAGREFARGTYTDVSEKERADIRQNLRQYCGQDTLGMSWIVANLRRLSD